MYEWSRRVSPSVSLSTDGLKQSTRAWARRPLASKHARCCQDLLRDQKENEPGRCRMRVQLNIACRDSWTWENPPHHHKYFYEQNALKVNSRGALENIHSPPMNVQYLSFFSQGFCCGNLMEMRLRRKKSCNQFMQRIPMDIQWI